MRLLALWLALLVGVSFSVWGFTGSSLGTVAAAVGAVGAVLLGLAVFGRVRRGPAGKGAALLVGAQLAYLALWIVGGVLWAGPPRRLPHFAASLSLGELQGRWTREDGRVYEVRGGNLCRVVPPGPPSPGSCLRLMEEGGRLTVLVDDLALLPRAYRRWGQEYLDAGMFGLEFSRPIPAR